MRLFRILGLGLLTFHLASCTPRDVNNGGGIYDANGQIQDSRLPYTVTQKGKSSPSCKVNNISGEFRPEAYIYFGNVGKDAFISPASKSCYFIGDIVPLKRNFKGNPEGSAKITKIVLTKASKLNQWQLKDIGVTDFVIRTSTAEGSLQLKAAKEKAATELADQNSRRKVFTEHEYLTLIYFEVQGNSKELTNLPEIVTKDNQRLSVCRPKSDGTYFEERYIYARDEDQADILSKKESASFKPGIRNCALVGMELPLQSGGKSEPSAKKVVVTKLILDTWRNLDMKHVTTLGFSKREDLHKELVRLNELMKVKAKKNLVAVMYFKPSGGPSDKPQPNLPEVLSLKNPAHKDKRLSSCKPKSDGTFFDEKFIFAKDEEQIAVLAKVESVNMKPAARNCAFIGQRLPLQSGAKGTPSTEQVVITKMILSKWDKLKTKHLSALGFATHQDLKTELDRLSTLMKVTTPSNFVTVTYYTPESKLGDLNTGFRPLVLAANINAHVGKTISPKTCSKKEQNAATVMDSSKLNALVTGKISAVILPGQVTNCLRIATVVDAGAGCTRESCRKSLFVEKILLKQRQSLTYIEAQDAGYADVSEISTKLLNWAQILPTNPDNFSLANITYFSVVKKSAKPAPGAGSNLVTPLELTKDDDSKTLWPSCKGAQPTVELTAKQDIVDSIEKLKMSETKKLFQLGTANCIETGAQEVQFVILDKTPKELASVMLEIEELNLYRVGDLFYPNKSLGHSIARQMKKSGYIQRATTDEVMKYFRQYKADLNSEDFISSIGLKKL